MTPPLGTGASSSPSINYIPTARSKRKETADAAANRADAKRRSLSTTSDSRADSTPTSQTNDDAPYSPGQLLDQDVSENLASANLQQVILEELERKIEEEKKQLASLSASAAVDISVVIPGLEPSSAIPGLGSDSVVPSADLSHNRRFHSPPATASDKSSLNQISIPTNLQVRE